MLQTACGILYQDQDLKLNIRGEFDGMQTFEQVAEIASSPASLGRVVLDFSDASRVRAIELFYLLTELAREPLFEETTFSIEGLRGKDMA
jgi:hypothetical protein